MQGNWYLYGISKVMSVLREKFKSDFKLKTTGGKGWWIAPIKTELKCIKCGNENGSKLSFIFDKYSSSSSFRCVKCGFSCRLEKYLWLIKKTQYITKYREIKQESILNKKGLSIKNDYVDLSPLPEVLLPLLFKKLKYSDYLQSRGLSIDIYKHFIIGKTDFDNTLKDYTIFVVTENEIPVGWVARCNKSKSYIDNYNKTHKRKILRWRNSTSSDFGKIVYGLDEINKNTKQIIIVEGISSKLKVDSELKTWNKDEIKCVCTFGKKISETQIAKILKKSEGLEDIILFYDVSDAINEEKKASFQILKECNINIFITYHNFKNQDESFKDAGDMSKEEILWCLNNKKNIFDFFYSVLPKRKLLR